MIRATTEERKDLLERLDAIYWTASTIHQLSDDIAEERRKDSFAAGNEIKSLSLMLLKEIGNIEEDITG